MGKLPKKGPGRPKGSPNKTSAMLKDMILQALNDAGGAAYLRKQATANPGPFLTLVGKVLPLQVSGDPENPISVGIVERVIVDPKGANAKN